MWLRDFHVDGLRLDAVHALYDDRAITLLEELSAEVGALSTRLGRPLWLIAESDRNDPLTVTPREAGGLGLHAQWADDVHHALHVLLDRRDARLLRGLRRSRRAREGARRRLPARRHVLDVPPPHPRAPGRPRSARPAGGSWSRCRPTTRSATARWATGCRPRLAPARLACGAALLLTRARHADAVHGRGVGRDRPPGSTSPTTPTPRSPRRYDAAGATSSPARVGPGRRPRPAVGPDRPNGRASTGPSAARTARAAACAGTPI